MREASQPLIERCSYLKRKTGFLCNRYLFVFKYFMSRSIKSMAQAHFHLRCCSSHAFSRHDYEQVIVAVTESLRFMPKIANTKSPNKSAVVWGI